MPAQSDPGRLRSGDGTERRLPRLERTWDNEVSGRYALGFFLLFVFAGFTLLVAGPWIGIDTMFNVQPAPPKLIPVLHVLDHVGQRAICLPCLLVMCFLLQRRTGRWRPLVVAVGANLVLNFSIGVMKLAFARGQPGSMNPDFFVGGMAYPSGHSSNVIVVYGLVPYILATYTNVSRRVIRILGAIVVFLCLWMVVVSVTLHWHWFSDLWGGLLVGGSVLAFTAGVDEAVPTAVFADGLWTGLRRLPGYVIRPVPRN